MSDKNDAALCMERGWKPGDTIQREEPVTGRMCGHFTITAIGEKSILYREGDSDREFKSCDMLKRFALRLIGSGDTNSPTSEQAVDDLGPHLEKATVDSFTYAIGTRDGSVFRFELAEVAGGWVTLTGCLTIHDAHETAAIGYFPPGAWKGPYDGRDDKGILRHDTESVSCIHLCRGAQIRLSDIVWVADSPEGS